jgi:hypothetical protein
MKRAAVAALLCLLVGCQDKVVPTKPAATSKPAADQAFDLPKSVALSLPPALNIVAQGAGNIVSQGAGNIVTNASSNVVAQGAGNIVTNASSNAVVKDRRLLADEALPFLATILPIYTQIYTSSTRKIDLAIAALRKAGLKDGMTVTFKDDDPVPELATCTVRFKRVGKVAVVQVCFGPTFDEAKIGGVAVFQDAKHGRLLVHPPLPTVKALLLASTFDHELHRASADGLVDGSLILGGIGGEDGTPIPVVASAERYHYEFEELNPAKQQGATFRMGVAAFRTNNEKPAFNGGYALEANFLADGGVAAVGGMQTPATGPEFLWFGGGALPVEASEPHALFAGITEGKLKDWPRSAATSAMQAIVPPDDAVAKTFPKSPLETDLEADPVFQVPRP